MKIVKLFTTLALILLVSVSICQAEKISDRNKIDAKEAIKIAKASLQKLLDESYHYRVDYDSLIIVPVHSRTIWKNDFYLIYFLKDGYFQAEMEVDRATKKATVLSMGKISQPYRAGGQGTFSLRYFVNDSVKHFAKRRQRVEIDSVRMVYFGVAPKFGKRGVCWETFSTDGPRFISLSGAILDSKQLVLELNGYQFAKGNRYRDSIRVVELLSELDRLEGLPPEERDELKIDQQTYDSLITSCNVELGEIYARFRQLRPRQPTSQK